MAKVCVRASQTNLHRAKALLGFAVIGEAWQCMAQPSNGKLFSRWSGAGCLLWAICPSTHTNPPHFFNPKSFVTKKENSDIRKAFIGPRCRSHNGCYVPNVTTS